MYRDTDDAMRDIKDQDARTHRAKFFHPQLKDNIKQEIILERKQKSKQRVTTRTNQRNLKQGEQYHDDTE